jgi:hypothetical protein
MLGGGGGGGGEEGEEGEEGEYKFIQNREEGNEGW